MYIRIVSGPWDGPTELRGLAGVKFFFHTFNVDSHKYTGQESAYKILDVYNKPNGFYHTSKTPSPQKSTSEKLV